MLSAYHNRHDIKNENLFRNSKYAKNRADEKFLIQLNSELINFEKSLAKKGKDYPNLFVIGPPRSGTTLLYQILCNSLHVSWPTNLMARFWECPTVGLKLSILFNMYQKESSLHSDYGVTDRLHEPHEFGYFWANCLRYSDLVIKEDNHAVKIDWNKLKQKIEILSSVAGSPFLYKNPIIGFHLSHLIKHIPNSVIVFIKRDFTNTAVSILRARKARYNDEKIWWSFRPPHVEKLKDRDPYFQIIEQLKSINSIFETECSKVRNTKIFTIIYENVNDEIDDLINQLSNHLKVKKKKYKIPKIGIRNYKNSAEYKIFKKLMSENDCNNL